MDRDDVTTSWVKSSYSNTGANCVEVAHTALGNVAIRDSKDPDGPVLRFTSAAWRELTRAITSSSL